MLRRVVFSVPALVVILAGMAFAAPGAAGTPLWPVDLSGSGSFRNATYPQIIASLSKKSSDPDSASRLFRLGVAYLQSGDTLNGLLCFERAPLQDPSISPLVWEQLGDVMAKKKLDSAVGCYERILTGAVPNRFRARIYRKICAVIKDDTDKILSPVVRQQYAGWRCDHRPATVEQACAGVDLLIRQGEWPEVGRFISHELTALNDTSQAIIIDLINAADPPDAAFSAANLFLIARIAADCERFAIAERMLARTKAKKDFAAAVGNKRYLRFRGRLSFMEGKNQEAVDNLTVYFKRYGYEPDLGLLVARACKMLDLTEKAAHWYDRFIAAAPHYRAIAEILWRRAWIEEEQGRTAGAARFYEKIYTKYPRSSRAEEAMLRYALCLFQSGRYHTAITELSALQAHYPQSQQLPAAGFWKAKALAKLDSLESAQRVLGEVIRRDPYDYYAHRARALLASMGVDSQSISFPPDTVSDTGRVVRWFDSISPPPATGLTGEDSTNLRRAVLSALIGRIPDAELFFEPVETANPTCLSLGFRIARFYQEIGAYSQSIRIGRRLLFRIPAGTRNALPLTVRRILFPDHYSDIIRREAAQRNVDPSFVYAVIRQESVFDPEIVSPVGAIGLMQIMPATGRSIARELHEDFSLDTLYTPAGNIRFGTYYLRKLLDQFDNSCELTLAGYNGGPPNAREWFQRNKEKDADLLVEGIGFSETRTYVKRVMANYWFYRVLDGKK